LCLVHQAFAFNFVVPVDNCSLVSATPVINFSLVSTTLW
jgi:hypothetical protein